MTKNNLIRFILFVIFILLFLVLLQKFDKYLSQNNFAKIIILSTFIINFFLGFLIKKVSRLSIYFFLSFVFILYSLNGLIILLNYKNIPQNKIAEILKKDSLIHDKRTMLQVVLDERSKGMEVYPYVVPREFLSKTNKEKLVLTPMPNSTYISCNEYGEWKRINTDNLGFNNKKNFKNFDVLLMGDSFSEGSCVKSIYEPANLLTNKHSIKTYNVGVSGNGPLTSLAIAHEIKNQLQFKRIVWFIYDNDFYDLSLEIQSKNLEKYLDKDYLSNKYFSKLKKISSFQKKFINNNIDSLDKKYSMKEDLLELRPLIFRINTLILNKKLNKDDFYKKKKELFKKIFFKLLILYPNKDIYVVYLPETSCFNLRDNDCKKRFEILESSSEQIKFLNFYKYIKENTKNYKFFYALQQEGAHFSPSGYNELINFIINKIN